MIKSLLRSDKPLALMLIKAHKEVFNSIVGENSTKMKGIGYDFVELREYESGEDSKHIDWTISSKFTKPYVKVFQEERELNIVIVPILTASVNFGVSILKQDMIAEISALISFSSLKQNNPYSSYIANEETLLCSKKSKSLWEVREFIEKIKEYKTQRKAINYQELSKKLYTQEKQKSLLFLIGDFLDATAFDFQALALKHELVIILVRDSFEEAPPALGEIHIIDPQTGEEARINLTKKASKRVQKEMLTQDTLFFEKLKKAGIRFVKIYTEESPSKKIISLMSSL